MAVMQRTPCRWPTNGMRVSWLNWRALHPSVLSFPQFATSANDDPRAKPLEQLQDSCKGDCSGCGCGFRLRTNAENSVMPSPIGKG